LEEWLKKLRSFPLPNVKRGSLRLRVSPSGARGIWIDFANVDIKGLLDEGSWLSSLKNSAIVEIGQKNKRLIEKENRWKLGEAELFPWFETYLGEELRPQPLYLTLGGFTQTGFAANRLLISAAMKLLKETGEGEVLELFCGSGNFSLAMASRGYKVRGLELDALALEGLKKAAVEAGLDSHIRLTRRDLYRASTEELESPVWFVDPPRSGLRSVLDRLEDLAPGRRPQYILYVSCFLESWAEDAKKLGTMGYRLEKLKGVDQFPNTPHCEWISLFGR
jgi:23S rRNA (uracil1939-C5)-methyltransferase